MPLIYLYCQMLLEDLFLDFLCENATKLFIYTIYIGYNNIALYGYMAVYGLYGLYGYKRPTMRTLCLAAAVVKSPRELKRNAALALVLQVSYTPIVHS